MRNGKINPKDHRDGLSADELLFRHFTDQFAGGSEPDSDDFFLLQHLMAMLSLSETSAPIATAAELQQALFLMTAILERDVWGEVTASTELKRAATEVVRRFLPDPLSQQLASQSSMCMNIAAHARSSLKKNSDRK